MILRQLYNLYLSSDKDFVGHLYHVSDILPNEVFLYRLALTHSSYLNGQPVTTPEIQAARYCNERLEFLGDSILDMMVAEYLFKRYPTKDEGFLTEMRSKIVNRNILNEICQKIQLDKLIKHNQMGSQNQSMYGDALEAYIGALYLDRGYKKAWKFAYERIILPHLDFENIENQVISYKNKLIEYVQKNKMGLLEFEVVEETTAPHGKMFVVRAKAGNEELGRGMGRSKKLAEQNASQNALSKLVS